MLEELRKTGISVVGDVPWGTHFCHFYETKQDLLDILIPYFNTGLENNELCVWVVSDPLGEEEAKNAFRQAVPEADRYLTTGHIEIYSHSIFPSSRQQTSPPGRIEIVPHTDWYLKGGAFIAEQVLDGWNEKLADALAKGYAGLRGNGNEAWLTEENRKDFIQYEKTLDEKLADQRMIVLCSYPLSSSSAAQIFDVVNTHQLAVIRRHGNWEVLETPELKRAQQEIQRLNEELEQRVVERTRELAAANEELRREIAERQRAEEAVRGSEEHLRLVIDTIPVMAWCMQPNGVVDFLNQRWMDYFGLSLQQYVADPTGPVHPEDLPRVMEKWRRNMAAGESNEDEIRLRRADGEYRWFLVRNEPLRDEQGNVVKWYGSSTDIDDRKQAEEKLRHSEVQLAQAQRLARIGSWDWDVRTNAVTWSEELYHIFGLPPGTISVAGDVDRFIHPDDLEFGWDTVKRAIASKEPYDYYHRIIRPDGTERIARSHGAVVTDDHGEPIRVFGATQDVTELKHAEEKLKSTTEQLRALSARLRFAREEESKRIAREIHDELGGDLTSLRWDLEELGEIISEGPDSTRFMALRNKVDTLINLTDTTLETVRRLSSELRPIALDELGLVEAIESQARQFESRTGLAVDYECSLDKVDLDGQQSIAVFRILQEALTNILRHSQATGVTITMKQESGEFFLAIKDNGRGITESEKSGAHSLGLLGMRERALLIGATIDITATPGEGTEVVVKIPISASD